LLGAAVAPLSYAEWRRNQRAIRLGEPMPASKLPKVLAATVGVIALLATAVDLYSKATGR
jgi:putative membrane protein